MGENASGGFSISFAKLDAMYEKRRAEAGPPEWWDCCICGRGMYCPRRLASTCPFCGICQIHDVWEPEFFDDSPTSTLSEAP